MYESDTLQIDKEKLQRACPFGPAVAEVFECLDSTSTYLASFANGECKTARIAVAKTQTNARGRIGKSFCASDPGGLYFSILFRKVLPQDCLLTVCAAVALSRALKSCCGADTGIKWVNDVFFEGKKLAGILCESPAENVYIVGVGVNLNTVKFPPELENTATSLNGDFSKEDIAAEFLKELGLCIGMPHGELMDEYRKLSAVIGKKIRYERNGSAVTGTAVSIENDGSLKVLTGNGEDLLFYGEISISVNASETQQV